MRGGIAAALLVVLALCACGKYAPPRRPAPTAAAPAAPAETEEEEAAPEEAAP